MVTAVAGMVDPARGNISQTRCEVCEFVAARSGASQPAASLLL